MSQYIHSYEYKTHNKVRKYMYLSYIFIYIYIYDYDREIERERFIKEKEIIRYLFICLYFLLFIRLR